MAVTKTKTKVKVELFIPCYIDKMFPNVAISMVKLLEKLNCEVNYNMEQTCCGQPAYNAGFFDDCVPMAEKFIDDFGSSGKSYIVSPSASCVGMVKNGYNNLFKGSTHLYYKNVRSRMYELSEFLVDVLKIESIEGLSFPHKVTYHDSCSGLRECMLKDQPRKLLHMAEGLELVEMKDTSTCCGFGGTFAVKHEAISIAMGEQKINNALETGAEYIVSTDASCFINLQDILRQKNPNVKLIHLAEVLATGL